MIKLARAVLLLTRMETTGASMVADSPDEVRVRVREQLMQGASQIKLTAGGGVASPHSPLDVSTFTEPELRCRGSRRELGNLCHRARLYPGCHQAGRLQTSSWSRIPPGTSWSS
jgi:imidazolonepropionase-like amidohydrolase